MTEQLPWDIQTKRLNNKARRRRFVIRRLALFTLRIELFFNFLMHIFLYASHPSIRCAAYITQDERGHWKISTTPLPKPRAPTKTSFFWIFSKKISSKKLRLSASDAHPTQKRFLLRGRAPHAPRGHIRQSHKFLQGAAITGALHPCNKTYNV